MSSFVSQPIRQLVCALKSYPSAVEGCMAEARSWLIGSQESLQLLRPLLLWNPTTDELFNQAELDLKEALRVLADPVMLPDDQAESLWLAVSRYYGQLFQLQELEQKRPAFSPILILDQVIKIAFNVLHRHATMFDLQVRFPLAQAEVARLRQQIEIRRLFSDISWPEEISEGLRHIEAGLGALSRFLEVGNPVLLEHAIQLMGKGSAEVAQHLQNLETELRSQARFSPHDSIECWLRLREHPYDLGESATRFAWDRLFQEVDDYLRTLQLAQTGGLAISHPEIMSAAGLAHQQAFDQLGQLSAQNHPAETVAQMLNPAWDQMLAMRAKVQSGQGEVYSNFSPAPKMLELLEVLGQTAAGLSPTWVLKQHLNHCIQQQQASLEALRAASGVPETIEPLLSSHEQAFQRMLLYVEDENRDHLIQGWKILSLTLPPLMNFEAQLRREVAQQGKSGQQITCIRCSHVQKPQKICEQCGTTMPQYQIEDVRYELVVGGPGGSNSKVNVADQLVDLVQGLTFGVSGWEHVGQEILRQLDVLGKTRDRFEKDMVKMMGTDESLDAYCQFFVVRLGQLTQSLMDLSQAAETRSIATLRGGLSAYRQLHEELMEFQRRIAEGLARTP